MKIWLALSTSLSFPSLSPTFSPSLSLYPTLSLSHFTHSLARSPARQPALSLSLYPTLSLSLLLLFIDQIILMQTQFKYQTYLLVDQTEFTTNQSCSLWK